MSRDDARPRGPLRAVELAEGVVLADLTLALCVVSRFVPFGGALVAIGIVPMAAIASRRRVRAALVGGLAAAVVGFLVAGFDLVITVGVCTALGALVGEAYRRGWGVVRTVLAGLALFWMPGSLVALAVLSLFTELRRLSLDQLRNSWEGASRTIRDLGWDRPAQWGDDVVSWSISHWWIVVPLVLGAAIVAGCGFGWLIGRRILGAFVVSREPAVLATDVADGRRPAPVPVVLDRVSVRFPGARTWALRDVDVRIGRGELVAVVGANGSGKSTLARVLIGAAPTEGQVLRAGPAGLGKRGGSAVVFQRPDAQVLGVRVVDDLRWGLPSTEPLDVDVLLARVGLAGFASRETATLSGGELQRLAVASASARTPQLLICDEATSMLDPDGRRELLALLRSFAEEGVTVVHITHDPEEAARADRTIALDAGRVVDRPRPAGPAATRSRPRLAPGRAGRVSVRGVGHRYSAGTPWEHRALDGIDLELPAGTGVLVTGHNGSGKSTLAWIIAGLLVPSSGRVLVDDTPIDQSVGRVGLSFQHARLQLLQRTVEAEICSTAGVGPSVAHDALRAVALDPATFASRAVDQLSGGEQRRVAIAGMLARRTPVLVLDEPFAGLDLPGRAQIVDVLVGLRGELGTTLIVISHEEVVPDGVAERRVRLEAGRHAADDDRPTKPDAAER
ncbi:MAG TPA: DUF2232 domain-containing protein [Acidimicrobiia bacterium]